MADHIPEPTYAPETEEKRLRMKAISQKDAEKMSRMELIKAAWKPYKRFVGYIKPYRKRFVIGLIFGVLFGLTNGLLVFTTHQVAKSIFEDNAPGQETSQEESSAEAGATDKGPSKKDIIEAARSGEGPGARSGGGQVQQVILVCGAIPLVMGIRNLFSYLNIYSMIWVGMRVMQDLRRELFNHIITQSMDFFDKAKVGELVQMVYSRTRVVQQAATQLASDLVKQPVSILSALGFMLFIDWKFTLVMFALFPICLIPVIILGRRVRKHGKEEEEVGGHLMVVMNEAFSGVRMIKAFARENYESKRVEDSNRQMLNHMLRWRKAMEMAGPLVEVVASTGVALALAYVYFFDLPLSKFLALNAGLILLYPPLKTLSRLHILLQKALSISTKLFEILDTPATITDSPHAIDLKTVKGDITFDDVKFSYRPDTPVLKNVNIEFAAGKYHALVGPSGAGKSTIFSLILRSYEVKGGAVLLDGYDVKQLKQKQLREHIGLVNQSVFLFHDTIYENIRYGKLEATEEEIHAAAERAFAHDFIMQQPQGYDTVIGDKGCLLSGGQQQRICIARTILKDAPILLLDEATSALDSESEEKIKLALEEFCQGRTVIAIAHRFASLQRADKIIVMDRGEVVEQGTHEELLGKGDGQYSRLYNLQSLQAVLE